MHYFIFIYLMLSRAQCRRMQMHALRAANVQTMAKYTPRKTIFNKT